MMPRSAGEGFAGAVVFACGGGVCAKLTELIGKMNVELHSFRPKAFLDAQAALQVREHEAASIHQQDSSSMVFGIMETSGPSSFDQK